MGMAVILSFHLSVEESPVLTDKRGQVDQIPVSNSFFIGAGRQHS